MAGFGLAFKRFVAEDLRAIPNQDVRRTLDRIESLQDEPRPPGGEKLSGQERYRVRQRAYRISYEIEDHRLIATVVKVGQRSKV